MDRDPLEVAGGRALVELIRREIPTARFLHAADFYGSAAPGSSLGKLAGGLIILSGRAQEGEPPLGAATPEERNAVVGRFAFAEATIGLVALLLLVLYFGGRLINRG